MALAGSQSGAAVLFIEEVLQATLDSLRQAEPCEFPRRLKFDRDAHVGMLPHSTHNCNATMRRFIVSATMMRMRESAVRPHGVANSASPLPVVP